MPDTNLNPYNIAEEDTAGRLRALGVLTPYQPQASPPIAAYGLDPSGMQPPQGLQQMGPAAPTWDAYKAANNFDATDYDAKQQIWNNYRDKVIGDIAAAHGEDPGTLRTYFEQQYAGDKPKAPTRSTAEFVGDTLSTPINAALRGVKSISDLASPGNALSRGIQGVVDESEANQSAVVRDERARVAREVAADEAQGGTGIMPTIAGMGRSPLQTAGNVVGGLAPALVAGAISGPAAPVVVPAVLGAQSGGQARGLIYGKLQGTPDASLMTRSPAYAQLRNSGMNEADAKAELAGIARNWPEVFGSALLGAVTGRIAPVERGLAGLTTGLQRPAVAALEAATNAAQSGGTQLASNAAIRNFLPDQSLTEGVARSTAEGAVMGGVLGGTIGGRPHAAAETTADSAPPAGASADPLALPAPAYRIGAPDAPQGFAMGESQYNATPADVQAILDGLPKIVNRDYIGNHLTSDLRNGTLEQTAQMQNSLGRAAQRLLSRLQEQAQPRQLEAPEATPALPSPDMPDTSGNLVADASGNVQRPTYQQSADARAARQAAVDTGLTGDIRNAQEARARDATQTTGEAVEPAPDASGRGVPEQEPATDTAAVREDGAGDAGSATDAATGSTDASLTGRPVVLQNRDRSSAAAIAQMNSIAADPDHARLSFSRDFANGAPVVEANPGADIPADQLGRQDFAVAADGRRIPVQYAVVDAGSLLPSNRADGSPVAGYAEGTGTQLRAIAGNGRAAALQAAYERGTADTYRQGIAHDAELTGVSQKVISSMRQPVLVRVMPRDHVTADIGDVSNTAGTAALSPVEQAQNDMNRVDLDKLEFSDAGEPTPESVRQFVQSMPTSEQVGLLNPDGTPTRQAVDRLMAATFQKAYGDPELVRLYAQATDPEARTVLGGMADAAGSMARLDGAGDLDVRSLVTEAARAAVNARRQGVRLNEFARQQDLALNPEAREFVQLFADNVRSGKRIGETLKRVADFAYGESVKPTEDMFGSVERATREQVLSEVNNDTRRAQDLGLAAGREPVATSDSRQGAETAGRANGRPAEEVGAAGRGEAAQQPAGGERSGEAVTQRPTPKRVQDRVAERRRAREAAANGPAADAPLLTNPTPETLRQRVERQRAAKAEDERAQRAADQRAEADAQRSDFRLTGSDRDADRAAANGQDPLFSSDRRRSDTTAPNHEAPPREGLSVSGRMTGDAVRRAIERDTHGHHVDVYDTLADAPEYVRRQAEAEGAHDVEGFFDPRTNRVALIADNLASPARAREVARHELIGHYGLENMVGRDTMRELTGRVIAAERLGNKAFREIGEEVDRTQPGLPDQRRAKEMIALMAERNVQNSVVRRVIDAVRQFLKRAGLLRGDVTDAEVAATLRDAQRYLRERGRSVTGDELATEFSTSGRTPTIRDLSVKNRQVFERAYRDAAAAKPEFDKALRGIAEAMNGYALTPELKGRERAIDKVVSDYAGDATKIKDVLRGTIVAPNVDAARDAIRQIGERFDIVGDSRNLLARESKASGDGYRDAKLNVRSNGVTAEIQVNVPEMIAAKKQAHSLYIERSRIARDLEAGSNAPHKEARVGELDRKMREIYDAAWERALRTNDMNSSGDNGLPLRRADSDENLRGGSVSQAAQYSPASGSRIETGMPEPSKSYSSASGESADASGSAERAIGNTSESSITDNEPADFARAGAPASSVPQVERKPTFWENMRAMSRNPTAAKSAARTFLSEGGSAAQPKWLETVTTSLFDHLNPIEQIIRRTGDTPAGRTLRNTVRLFQGATEKTRQDFVRQSVDPTMKALSDAYKRDFAQLDWYASRPGDEGWQQFLMDTGTVGNLIKHGRERNAEIARKTDGRDLAGSGRTNEEIDAFERDVRRDAPGLIEFYEKFYGEHLKPMLDYRDQTLRDAGLLTPEMESGRPKYQWYVPLKGDPNAADSETSSSSGGGGLKSPKEKQAMGRSGTLADNVLQNVFEASDSAIRRAGWQQLKRDMVQFIKATPSAKALLSARINEAPNHYEIFEKYVGQDGIVHERVKPNAAMSPEALVLRDGNQTTIVHIGNRKVLDALQGANRAQIDGVFSLPQRATRLLSAIYTRYNPMFPPMNKLRDVQSMMSLVMADAPTDDKIGAVRRALANNVGFTADWRMKPAGEYHKWAERYEKLGGSTLYQDLFRDDTMKNLENEFGKMVGATTKFKAKAAAGKIGDFIDRVNEHMEMSSRVSLFKALVESRVPERDAALYVKDTMNFETKGKLGQQLGAIYTFAGPALFDARRMAQALRTPRGAAVMLAHYALMYSLYGALKSMGGQDDDGVDKLNKIPLSQSGRFLTMIDPSDPDGRGWKLPVGFGFGRIALTLAAATHRYADGIDDVGTFAGNVAKDGLLSNFSPVDPTDIDPSKDMAGWVMQQFMPSIAKPLLQLALNQTGQGSPIHKPDEWTGNKLKFEQGWPQTSALFRGLAKDLYDSTGVDVYPETISHLLRSYGGGGALDAIKAIQALGEDAGTDKSLTDIPLVRSFGSGPLRQDMVEFRERSTEADRLTNERQYAERQGRLDEFDAEHPNVERIAALYKAANSEIKKLYTEAKEARQIEDATERQQRVNEISRRVRATQMQANRAHRELQAQ
ncbi:hypothetical protein OKW41_006020 [Paraburkholderia sp. UCT70]|uniref:LPD38 domain-containing protein n=1 Tax=Paraburkholderia sp. UCT70 TaxID=2991068 RepID=UPI003D1FD8FA